MFPGSRFLLLAFCWIICIVWFIRDSSHNDGGGDEERGGASNPWRTRSAEAAAAALASRQALEGRQAQQPVKVGGSGAGSAAAAHPPPPPSSSSSSYSSSSSSSSSSGVPHPGNPDGLQYHGPFGVSPRWPTREFRCPVPVVLPSEPERYKRISHQFRNITVTLPYYVHGWGAARAGWEGREGDWVGGNTSSSHPTLRDHLPGGVTQGLAPLPLARTQSMEVARFVEVQEDILARFGVAMQVTSRFDVRLMSPAIVHIGGGRFLLFARVSCYPAELYDNLIWTQELDEALDPVPGTGGVIGVPTHSQFLMAPGPEDPRALTMNGEILVLFNHQFRNDDRRMIVYNHMQRRLSELRVEGLTQTRAEKNWMPFVHEGALHLVYQMTPLILIRCDLPSGDCVCVVPAGCSGTKGTSTKVYARGGTPMTRLTDTLYYGLIHSTYRFHMIRAHPVLLSTSPWGWVSLGGPLPFPESLPGCYEGQVPWDVQFPASCILLGPRGDALLLGIHVRDAMSALIHVDLGGSIVDTLAAVTEQACEEFGEGVLMAPEAPSDVTATTPQVGSGFSPTLEWLTDGGKTVRKCNKWAIMDSSLLDRLIQPMLH